MANYYKDDELLYTSGGSSQGVGVFTDRKSTRLNSSHVT